MKSKFFYVLAYNSICYYKLYYMQEISRYMTTTNCILLCSNSDIFFFGVWIKISVCSVKRWLGASCIPPNRKEAFEQFKEIDLGRESTVSLGNLVNLAYIHTSLYIIASRSVILQTTFCLYYANRKIAATLHRNRPKQFLKQWFLANIYFH